MRRLKICQRTQLLHQKCIFSKIQDGSGRHIEFRKLVAIPLLFDQLSPSLMGMLKMWPFNAIVTLKTHIYVNSRWRPPPSWISVNMNFWGTSCVLCQIFNISTKVGEDWSNSEGMATQFRNSRWRRPPSWIVVKLHFWCDNCVLCQILNIQTKFGEDRYNSKAVNKNNNYNKLSM